jgi:hypothetical protein
MLLHHIDCHDVILHWIGKEAHETLSPMFPAQASLIPGSKLAESGPPDPRSSISSAAVRQPDEVAGFPFRCSALWFISRALSFDGRKPGDERPNALMRLQRKHANPWTQFEAYPICCIRQLLPIMESITRSLIGGGRTPLMFPKQIPAACSQMARCFASETHRYEVTAAYKSVNNSISHSGDRHPVADLICQVPRVRIYVTLF